MSIIYGRESGTIVPFKQSHTLQDCLDWYLEPPHLEGPRQQGPQILRKRMRRSKRTKW